MPKASKYEKTPQVLAVLPLPKLVPSVASVTRIDQHPIYAIFREAFRKPFRPFEVIVINGSNLLRDTIYAAQAIASTNTMLLVTQCDGDSAEWKAVVAEGFVKWEEKDAFSDAVYGDWLKASFVADKLNDCASSYVAPLLGIADYTASIAREKELRSTFKTTRTFEIKTQIDVVEACIVKAMYPTMNVVLPTDPLVGVEYLKNNILI